MRPNAESITSPAIDSAFDIGRVKVHSYPSPDKSEYTAVRR